MSLGRIINFVSLYGFLGLAFAFILYVALIILLRKELGSSGFTIRIESAGTRLQRTFKVFSKVLEYSVLFMFFWAIIGYGLIYLFPGKMFKVF
jgi:hypothetical protein